MNTFKHLRLTTALFFLFFLSFSAYGQYTSWGLKIGGTGNDRGYSTKVAPNGNVYVAGYFSGTADLDPSSAVYNITSNGGEDIFLACYTPSGSFLWGFGIGGGTYDAIMDIDFDAQNNAFVVGYFSGTNVDFDPSISGYAPLTDNGMQGSFIPNWGGDGFVAKYSATGQYQWAFQLGSSFIYDVTESVSLDEDGNVYVGGTYVTAMDIDPSANVYTITSAFDGKSYIIKYSNNGELIWGFPFLSNGGAGVDCGVRAMNVAGGNIYITGFYEYTADFDPSPGTYTFSTPNLDMYVAKYDTAGNFIFANNIVGAGFDDARDITLDPAGNIYIVGVAGAGSTQLAFGTNTVPAQSGNGNSDFFIAKYTNSGAFIWANILGSTQNDWGESLVYADNHIFCSGYFGGTVDFDPSTAVSNLVSAGGTDIFITKYDLNGSYVCGFRAGGSGSDESWAIYPDAQNNLYASGVFSNTVDFDPSSAVYNLTTNDPAGDAFLVKYMYQGNGSGDLAGDTICEGEQAYLVYYDSLASGPITITLSDGSNNYTFTIQAGVPFALTPNPLVTTTYTWSTQGVGSQSACLASGSIGTLTILVYPKPVANAGPDTAICPWQSIELQGSGGTTYNWFPPAGLNNPGIPGPVFTDGNTTLITLVVTDQNNCSDSDAVTITILPQPISAAGPDMEVCPGTSVMLQGNGGNTYSWYPTAGMTGQQTATPTVTVFNTTVYYLVATNTYGCSDTDDVVVGIIPPPDFSVSPSPDVCIGSTAVLEASGGNIYLWYTDDTSVSNANIITVSPAATTMYHVAITSNLCNYTDTQSVLVNIHSLPEVKITRADPIGCGHEYGQLQATGAMKYIWTPGNTLNDDSIANPLSHALTETWYAVTGIDQYGCSGTDSALVRMISDNFHGLYVPTAFTPNSDGKNDCYRILQPPGITDFELHIYNRFGNNVFNADDATDCWDGTYKGELCDVGVYYYYYKFKSATCGKDIEGKGDITLIR